LEDQNMTMRGIVARLCALALALALPAVARAQGGHGSIIGNVLDQNGMPIKGVKISAKSDTQIGGSKVAYTSDEGSFRIVGLIPGDFEIMATAPKLKSFLQKGISVGLSAPAEVDIVMEVETKVEEVRVVEKAPIVSTTTAVVKEVFDEEFIDNIPVDTKTSGEATVANMVPGTVGSGVRSVRMRGGGNTQSHFMVDGFYMNGQRSTLKAMAAVEVQTAAQGADNASASGGVVNMVTKSGSNKFEFDINAYAEDKTMQFFLDESDNPERSYYYMVNPNFSGPIIKDRLWYFFNFEGRVEYRTVESDPFGKAPKPHGKNYGSFRGSGKITWQVTPRNKLANLTNFDLRYDQYTQQGYAPYYEDDAQHRTDDRNWFSGLIWEALLADNVFFKSQAGVTRNWNTSGPMQCKTNPDCDHVISIRNVDTTAGNREVYLQNYPSRSQTILDKIQVVNTLEFFPSSKTLGDHDIKLKAEFFQESNERAESVPGDKVIRLNNGAPDRETYSFANDPRLSDLRYGWFIRRGEAQKWVASLSDAWRATRYLTLTPGVAFNYGKALNSRGDTPVDASAFTPHLAVAYDPTRDGRTVLRGSFNGYVDVNMIGMSQHSLGSRVQQECRWDEASQTYSRECTYSGGLSGATFGLPCGPTGFNERGQPCRERLAIPRTWEGTLGAERELVQGVGLGADVIYRTYRNQFEARETNRVWNKTGASLDPNGGYRNGKIQTVNDMGTPDGARRDYLGFTLALHKREGRFKTSTAYTWSSLQGTVLDGTNNYYGDIPARDPFLWGYLPDDSRHNLKITMTYQWAQWLSTGILYNYFSGGPIDRRYRNDVTGGFEDFRARVGINPGSNINDPGDDRPAREADLQMINLQARFNLKPLTGIYLDVYADLMNVLALRTPTGYVQNDGPSWGSPSGSRMGPMKGRIGFRYKY
jgi:hypothetical protein